MSWKGEKQRHSMSAKGVSSKFAVLKRNHKRQRVKEEQIEAEEFLNKAIQNRRDVTVPLYLYIHGVEYIREVATKNKEKLNIKTITPIKGWYKPTFFVQLNDGTIIRFREVGFE